MVHIKEKLKVLSLFSGIGAFESGLERARIDYELVGFSEIDKYAITAYSAIHNADKKLNLGDVGNIKTDDIPDCDLITYGFPCQDISVAGLGKGIIEGKTRSGLLHEALRIIKAKKPKYAIAENVKNLTGKKFKDDFDALLVELNSCGYNSYWDVLNAKDFGVPQNRERVFIVSIRKDIDDGRFEFPEGFDHGVRLKDLIDEQVDEKYYIENKNVGVLISSLQEESRIKEGVICAQRGGYNSDGEVEQRMEVQHSGLSNTLTTVQKDDYLTESNKLNFVGGINNKDWVGDGKQLSRNYPQGNRVYDSNGIACSQTAQGGGIGSFTGLYLESNPNKLKLFTTLSGGKWDRVKDSLKRVYDADGVAPTIDTCQGGHREPKVYSKYRVRKLTPNECWRLMGFLNQDYEVARQALMDTYYNGKDRTNSQMYKMAGNSIVVNVLEKIYKKLF